MVNEQYKAKFNKNCTHPEFRPGDLVWLYLRKERFPLRRKSKLMARGDGPYKIMQRVRDNAYKIELPSDMNISTRFNVRGLTPYIEDEDEGHKDLRANPLQVGSLMWSKSNNSTSLITSKPWYGLSLWSQ